MLEDEYEASELDAAATASAELELASCSAAAVWDAARRDAAAIELLDDDAAAAIAELEVAEAAKTEAASADDVLYSFLAVASDARDEVDQDSAADRWATELELDE